MRPNQQNSRSTKTLGWFMADDLFDKKNMKNPEKEVEIAKSPPQEERKKKRSKKPQMHKRVEQIRTPSESSGTCEEVMEEKQRVLGTVPSFTPKDVPLAFYVPNDNKTEDFWYYDVASDGYYYEQNGAKGWRRRMPNSVMQKIKEQENQILAANNNKLPPNLLNAQAAAQAVLLQQALMAQQNQPPLKPPNQLFRNQQQLAAQAGGHNLHHQIPNVQNLAAAQLAAVHAAAVQSYGAALARGQLPRNTIIDESSASSSVSEDTTAHDLYYDQLPRAAVSKNAPNHAPSHVPSNQKQANPLLDPASFPPITRPDQLNIDENQRVPNFNADKFIQDLSFSGLDPIKVLGMASRTPVSSWSSVASRTTHSTSTSNSVQATPTSATLPLQTPNFVQISNQLQNNNRNVWSEFAQNGITKEDESMAKIMADLEKIWA
ncbi:hypothetical protein WR25_21770 isoform B [Diploscapter pachys]|uniref:Uncharacterized protein n=1 Tax=Diploscapter pachys TaxID=2018661 RepID=A0A2A2LF69_9BILA|nr:hypothetical protein WR25_21770 isoform A [Diploscapter pachys]PAV84911.1 hypothetical protein WR25_21770 isoform B [Diploscapter pachys]